MLPEIRQELRKFAESTTVKGIGRTLRANNGVARTCWIVFLVICLALLLFQVVTVLLNYYSYVVVQNTAVVQTSPNFPDVSVCNLFPVSDRNNFDERYKSYLKKLAFLRSHQKSPEKYRSDQIFWRFLRSLTVYNVNTLDPHIDTNADPNVDGFVVKLSRYLWDFYDPISIPLVLENGQPLQRCVRISPVTYDVAMVNVMLFVNDFWSDVVDSYSSWIRTPMSTGVRVMVHARGTKPDMKSSILVAPGTDLTITVKQTNVTRLSIPWSNCTNQRMMNSDFLDSIPYSQANCISLCRQRQVVSECNCITNFEFFTEAELQAVNGTFCLNITQFMRDWPNVNDSVIEDIWNLINCTWSINPLEEHCDCPVQCSEISYEFSVSGARWPSPLYQLAFYDIYLRRKAHYASKFSVYETLKGEQQGLGGLDTLKRVRDLTLIEDNFLQVTVKMNERSVTTVTDILAMSWDTMASNLGGSLNLWLGISVLTAAEIIELLYSLIQILWYKKRTDVVVPRKTVDTPMSPALK